MTTTVPSAAARPADAGRSAPPGPAVVDPLRLLGRLTARDRRIIDTLGEHQVLTTGQLAQLAFPSLDTAQHRLVRLHRLGVLDRFRWHTPVGSASWHYTLGPAGAGILAAARGTEPPRPSELHRRSLRLATSPRLAHLLGINGWFTTLAAYARTHPEAALSAWWSERRCAEHYGQIVRPDGYGAWAERDRTVEFFLEYDTGSETLGRLVAKLAGYADLTTAGGPDRPVLFWLPSLARETHLHRHLARQPAPGHIATATAEMAIALSADPPGPLWLTPGADRRRRLIDLDTAGLRR